MVVSSRSRPVQAGPVCVDGAVGAGGAASWDGTTGSDDVGSRDAVSSPDEPAAPGPSGGIMERRRSARAFLPADDRAPFAARRLVSTLLLSWGYGQAVEMGELVVSEIVSNAVRHAGHAGDLDLELVAVDHDVIQLSVADGLPTMRQPRADGLGFRLIERVALEWGVVEHLLGKQVWVRLPARPRRDGRRFPGTRPAPTARVNPGRRPIGEVDTPLPNPPPPTAPSPQDRPEGTPIPEDRATGKAEDRATGEPVTRERPPD